MEKDRKFRALAIAAICVAIVGVSVAYAALSASLTVNGTATVNTENSWNVKWTSVSTKSKTAGVSYATSGEPTIEGTQNIKWSATFSAPGDTLVIEAKLKNAGSINAELENKTDYLTITGDDADKFTYTVKEGSTNINDKAGKVLPGNSDEKTLTITVQLSSDLTNEQLTALNNKAVSFGLTLPWIQGPETIVTDGEF